jgi:hypothetical protein
LQVKGAARERYGGQHRRIFRAEARAKEAYQRLLQSAPQPTRVRPKPQRLTGRLRAGVRPVPIGVRERL